MNTKRKEWFRRGRWLAIGALIAISLHNTHAWAQTYRAAASANAGSGTLSLTINKPAGTISGDVMIAAIAVRPYTATITPPSGWTLIRRTDQSTGNNNAQATYYRVAGSSEPASYSWTFSTSTGSAGGILTFYDVDTSAPIDVQNGQATASGLTHATPSVTTTYNNDFVVTSHQITSASTWTPPAGMTEAVDVASGIVPNAVGISLEMNYVLQASLGATGTKTATASNDADTGVAQIVAIHPAPKTWDGGAGTNNWGDGNNWNPNGVPTSTDDVILTGANTININVAATTSDLTINNSGLTLTIQSTRSLTVSGNLSMASGTFNTQASFPTVSGSVSLSGGTFGYTLSGNQTVSARTYYSLALSGSGTKTMPGSAMTVNNDFTMSGTPTATAAAALTVNGDFTIGNGCTFGAASYTHNVAGDFTNGGTFTASTSTINLNGSSGQSIGGASSTTFNSLTLNDASGLTLSTSATVNATLTLTSGKITLGSNNLTIGSAGTISGATSAKYIVTDSSGVLIRQSVGTTAVAFPVGISSSYLPTTVKTGSGTADFSFRVDSTVNPSLGNNETAVKRTWVLGRTSGAGNPSQITLQWNSGDEGSSFTRASAKSYLYSTSYWANTGSASVSGSNPYTATITGLSTMGSYIVAMPYTISGKVFEDVNYGGGAGRNWTTASGSGGSARSSARVELFDSGGNYLTNATTDGSGNYSFSNYASGTYYVRTVTGSVTSSRTGYTGSCLPVMTFRTDAAGGSAADVTTYVGGHDPATADAGNASSGWVLNGSTGAFSGGGSGKAHAFMQAAVGTANITGADFGWNFDTIANVNNTGQGSLRQFVTNANTLGGDASLAQSGLVAAKENAVFMISNGTAGSGLRSANNYFSGGIATISLASGLPTISTVVVLDAQKQPGWSSAPIIELNGAGAGSARGIDLSAGSSTVRGFIINRFASAPAIYIATAGSNTIQGNYIGTNSAGSAASANLQGIYVGAVSGNNIGGTGASQGNVISGNNGYGIQVDGSSTVIQGNYIGTNAAGAAAVANTGYGIIVSATATSTTVGGTGAGAGNVISGNTGYGLQILSNGHNIQGNKIGINAAGNSGIANTTSGVYVSGANNTIGGSAGGAGNIIAYNTSSGIVVATSTATGNLISRNSIYSNGSIGIDLGANGVTANDGAKTGSQPNQYMDFPVFTAITLSGTSLTVSGYVGSAANQSTFASATVEIFKSDGDSSGYGEGQTYLGNLTADANGNFSGTITVSGLTYGNSITGTATDGSNNTSEFGPNGVTSGTFYSKSSAAVSTPSNWNTARNGSGTDATAYGLGGTWIVQNSHSMTLSGSTGWDVSGTGTVEIESGGFWTNSSSGTVTTGTLHADNGGTYSHSTTASLPGTTRTFDATSTVNYSASADQSVVSLTYGHLTTSGSGTKTLAGNAAVAGDLTVSAGTLNLSTSTANRSSAGGTLTVSNGATLKIGGTNGFPSNYTTKSLGSTSTVEYSGTNQSVSGETYGHLTLSGSGTKTVANSTTAQGNLTTSGTASASCSGSLTVNGNVSIGSSTGFNGGSGTIDFNGALTVTSATFTSTSGSLYVYGDVSITGTTFDHHSGTIVLDGADATLTASGAALNNLTINRVTKAKAVSLGAHLTVQGTLTITSGYLIQDPSYNLWAGGINIGVNGILKNYGTGSLTLGGNVTNAGRVDFNGGGDATCTNSNRILIRSSVDGTQRSWSGDGVDIGMVDVDVKDQGGTAPITCYGSNSSGNNGANWTISNSCLHAPTAVNLISFAAGEDPSGVRLEWQTGFEVHNLGFHIYREGAGGLQRLTPSPIAGSALFAGARTALTAGRRYVWWDRSSVGSSGARYWLEDIDTSGQSTKHGPVVAVAGTAAGSASSNSPLLSQLGRSDRTRPSVTSSRLEKQALVESSSGATAVKLGVRQTGWYRVTQAQLLAAGVPASADPRLFQMYVDGSEIPIQVKAKSEKKFDAGDTVEFYGTALDTRWTDTHVYWLSWGNAAGKRIPLSPAGGPNAVGPSYPATLEERPKTIYFAALLNGDADNFFGPVITTDPLDETLTLANLDPSAPADAGLELTLQGATDDAHKVRVELNGAELGTVSFSGQATGSAGLHFSQNLLHNGSNTLRLTSLNGETDVSLVDTIRLNYYHLYASDGSAQWMSFPGGQAVTATGWPSPNVRIMDVTNPQSPVECAASVAAAGSAYSVTATAPTAQARVFAFDSSAALAPVFIKPFAATAFESSATVDVTIVTHPDFLSAASVLKQSQESSGLHSTIVTTEQLYDAYSYGAKSPDAIRAFVLRDRASRRKTRYLLLLGDASFDPRNYLGLGEYDYVPTKMVDTRVLEAASDDWFAIQQGGNLPLAAVGRLPVRTAAEADAVAAKIAAYRNQPLDAPWRKKALLVADENDSWDFERSNETLRANLETHLSVQTVYHGQLGTPATRTAILNGINDGQGWVNYFGHGSVDLWRDGILTSSDAAALTNSAMLPVFFDMTCLNGYFTDLYSESLGEALLKAPNGGAVGVWASSGLTEPAGQVTMNLEVWRQLQLPGATLGQSMIGAKQVATDTDVRQTWVLLGDPSLPSPLAAPVPADTTPPAISTVSDLSGQTWALIYWRTDEDADAQVKYGTAVPYSSASSLDTTLQTDHYVMLTGLQPGTLYHYQVLSSDSAGNSVSSTNYTFKTKDAPDTTPPVISDVNATVATNTVTITWKTDEKADAQVEYGTSNSLRRPRELTAVQKDDSTSHSVMIEGLSPKTRYHYRVQSRDAAGNLAVSEDYSFTTLKANDGGVRLMTDTPGRIGLMAPVSATEYGISTGRSSISERLFAARTADTAVQTGIALVNLGAEEANLTLTLYGADGSPARRANLTNPVTRKLMPGAQVQIVDSDLFGNEATELEPGGWILVESSVSDVAGLFVNFSTDLLLDGAAMSNTPLRSFVFPEIETSTKVRIANPNAEPAEVRLDLVEGSGKISSSLVREVVANGTLELDLGKDRAKDADGAEYLQVSSNRPVFGFNGLPGQDASGGLTLLYGTDYSAGEQSQSDLSVVNLDNIAGRVTFRLIGDEGLQIGQTRSLKIEAHGKLRVLDPLFVRASGQGYVEITSDGIRLAGSLVVRGADGKTAASALPLVADLQREMVFSHVSSDDWFFTEFVVVNPGPSEAMATIELLGADGIREAAVTSNIAARGRKRMPLTELFPALAGKALAGGYVRIVVDQPVAAHSLTGAGNTRSLLCLPAQEIP